MARSSNWRINRSSIMAVEGAQALKALQKVAGAAGLPDRFKVKFATKGRTTGIDFDHKEVVIGAGRLFHEAPISPDLFDVLVGLTLHEVGHERIRTDKMWNLAKTVSGKAMWSPTEQDLFQKFCNIGEDIVVESRTRANPNLAEYDEVLHKWAVAQLRAAQPNKLMEVWIEYALGHKSASIMNLPDELVEPMQKLVALTGWLRNQVQDGSYGQRARAYFDYWKVVKDALLGLLEPPPRDKADNQSEQPILDNQPEPPQDSGAENKSPADPEPNNEAAGNSGEMDSTPEPGDNSGQPGDGDGEGQDDSKAEMDIPLAPKPEDSINDNLAIAIEDAIETDQEDITDEVIAEFQEQLGNKYSAGCSIIRSRETRTPLVKPDPILRKQLERILTIRKRLQARTMHGEQYGRIDKRHLHRIGTDKRIFSLRYKFPDGFPNTRILIDLSGSMSGKQADEVLEAAGALQTLVNAEVWCYNHEDKTRLVRMDDGKLIHRFEPSGTTPSGQAIVGVALGMKKDGLVIHLTDGESNYGQAPWSAHWILAKRGINLVNLIWGGSVKQYNLEYNLVGMNYRQLKGLAEFPAALYQILVEQVKLAKMGSK